MSTIAEFLNGHPFYKARLRRLEHRASRLDLADVSLSPAQALALEAYILNRPERFFERTCFLHVVSLLRQVSPTSLLVPGNITTGPEINEAFLALRRTNRVFGDPAREGYSNERLQHALHEEIFPDYVKLAEEIYSPLVGYIAELQALSAGRPYKPLPKDKDLSPLRNRWERAKRWLPPPFHACFHANIRNSIAHATLVFEPYEVRFRDSSGPDILVSHQRAEGLAAELLDVCNAIAAAVVLHYTTIDQTQANFLPLPFLRTHLVLSASNTDLLHTESCFESVAGGAPQLEAHGTHRHWRHENLLFDIIRTIVYAHHHFPQSDRIFVSYNDHRRAPAFYGMPASFIPSLDAPAETLSKLTAQLGKEGAAWIEHESIFASLASKLQGVGSVLNWLHAVPVSMSSGVDKEPDYELRELLDISVGFRERFRAILVSDPRPSDLSADGAPTKNYLQFLFGETYKRWLFRQRQGRPLGANRLRILQCAVIEVHRTDRRLRKLRDSGLQDNFLFRFEWGIGKTPSIALFGSTLQQIGGFTVTVNVHARSGSGDPAIDDDSES